MTRLGVGVLGAGRFAEFVLAAAASHVFCEKPVALTDAEATGDPRCRCRQ